MGKIKDLTGKQFGRLTAVERMPPHGKNSCYMWVCKCECGGTAIVRGSDLTNGHTMSCGCYRRMQRAIPNSQLRLHRIWANMKQRCTNPKTKDFRYYGARGIQVCEEWQDFESFFYWAMSNGYQDGLTIERKTMTATTSLATVNGYPRTASNGIRLEQNDTPTVEKCSLFPNYVEFSVCLGVRWQTD